MDKLERLRRKLDLIKAAARGMVFSVDKGDDLLLDREEASSAVYAIELEIEDMVAVIEDLELEAAVARVR